MMPAVQASRRASPALIRVPSPRVPTPVAGGEAVVGDGHHHRGGGAAVQRQPVRVDGLEQRAERLAAALVGGHPPPVRLVHDLVTDRRPVATRRREVVSRRGAVNASR